MNNEPSKHQRWIPAIVDRGILDDRCSLESYELFNGLYIDNKIKFFLNAPQVQPPDYWSSLSSITSSTESKADTSTSKAAKNIYRCRPTLTEGVEWLNEYYVEQFSNALISQSPLEVKHHSIRSFTSGASATMDRGFVFGELEIPKEVSEAATSFAYQLSHTRPLECILKILLRKDSETSNCVNFGRILQNRQCYSET